MKKIFVFLIFLLAMSITMIGCSSGTTSDENENTGDSSDSSSSDNQGGDGASAGSFTYWYPWGGDSETWDEWRMEKYEEETGVSIDAVYAPPDGGLSNGKLLSAISGGNPPDLVISNDYALAYGLAAQGALEPIDEYLANAGFSEDDVLEGFVPLMKQEDGNTYLFPQDSNVNLLYYNVEMFEEAGLDPDQPPQTIEELDAAAEALTKVEGDEIERLGFIPWLDAGDGSYLWGWVFGANFFDPENNQVTLNQQALIDTYEWMDGYAQKYNPEKIKSFTSGFGGAFSPDHPFFTGKVAMTVNGNWFANALKLYSPDTEYRVAAIPSPEGGRENATTFGTNVFLVPKGAENPQAAIDFALYGSKQDILADNINTWRSISIWKETTDAIEWENDHVYDMVLDVAASSNSGHPALTSIAGQMADELMSLRDSVIYNDNNVADLLQAAEEKMQKEVDEN
ncbi:extracellular solute-binding protein [Aquibacillus albus]|uniref:Multiple sugar transport system substrate-binding protein n=1 Tax=Aquibacillus albus TaxID=1168171 RepID=A0ABS2MVV5_9BACI|nr:extracellular solute-binding protein [Aquibacillus albus]MBM7569982.1 multiple sugar transport system substrate-binding protein [Aquibacillus albus]